MKPTLYTQQPFLQDFFSKILTIPEARNVTQSDDSW